jgi:hypothetical protein
MGKSRWAAGNVLERIIWWLSPAWYYRREQFRGALRQVQENASVSSRRQSDHTGWTRWDDPNNSLSPERLAGYHGDGDRDRRRQWFR